MLYQLSYARVFASGKVGEGCGAVQGFFFTEENACDARQIFAPPPSAFVSKHVVIPRRSVGVGEGGGQCGIGFQPVRNRSDANDHRMGRLGWCAWTASRRRTRILSANVAAGTGWKPIPHCRHGTAEIHKNQAPVFRASDSFAFLMRQPCCATAPVLTKGEDAPFMRGSFSRHSQEPTLKTT